MTRESIIDHPAGDAWRRVPGGDFLRRVHRRGGLIIAITQLAACSDPVDYNCPRDAAETFETYRQRYCYVEFLRISPAEPKLVIGRGMTLVAITDLTPACGPISNPALLGWTSSNPTVAAITREGAEQADVEGRSLGTATITVRTVRPRQVLACLGPYEKQVAITVRPMMVTRIAVSARSTSVVVADTLHLRAAVFDDEDVSVTRDVSVAWRSSAPQIATVDAQGIVTAQAKGPVRITAAVGQIEGYLDLAVIDPPDVAVSRIRIDSGVTTVQAAKTIEVTATPVAASGTLLTDRLVSWTSRTPTVASVAPTGPNGAPSGPNDTRVGVVAGGKIGKSWIVAESEGKTDSIEVTVIPGDVAKVVVTPASVSLRVGRSMQLSAEARDLKDNIVPNRTFAWTSVVPAVATVSADGIATAVAQGTGEIRASTAGVNGSAAITVTPLRIAYGVANQPQAGSYTAAMSFNSSGGPVTVTRQPGPGSYRVTFAGQRPPSGEAETILVSRYGEGNHYCKLAGDWTYGAGTELVADVQCFNYLGSPVDAEFSIMLLGDDVLFGRFGFALANQPSAAAAYTPAKSYNSGPSNPPPVSVTRVGTGRYVVSFPGNGGGLNDPEAIHVTAAGPGSARCNASSPFAQASVEVRCYSPTNIVPMDSPFAITLLDRGRGGGLRAGYAWTVDNNEEEIEVPGVYTISGVRSHNSSQGQVELTKLDDVGRYVVTFRGLMPPGSTPTLGVQVLDRDADEPMFCNVVGWTIASPDLRVTVQCWHSDDGEPEDEGFYLIVIQ